MKNSKFGDWCERFRVNYKGTVALKYLKEQYMDDNKKEFPLLEVLVLRACYHAATYSTKHDLFELKCQNDSICANELERVIDAIAVIREFKSKCPENSQWVLGIAPPQPGVKFGASDALQEHILFDSLLEKCARGLKRSRGNMIGMYHRMRQGNLVYPTPVDKYPARQDIAVLGLIFELVFLFKRWTSLVSGRRVSDLPCPEEVLSNEHSSATTKDPRQIISFPNQRWCSRMEGASLPTEGRPNYKLVAAFVNAALNRNLSFSQVDESLRRLHRNHPSVSLSAWPHTKKVDF
jgi:hypothetical protein